MENCIYCKKEFEPYMIEVTCPVCDGEGIIEHEDDFMASDYRLCWQCKGREIMNITELAFCDEDCREEYFEYQLEQ